MIFPLRKFWTYSPHGFAAAIIWNISEICGFQQQERDEALERLKPFAFYFDLNDCDGRKDDDALEIPIKDLRAARDLIRRLAAGTEKEKNGI